MLPELRRRLHFISTRGNIEARHLKPERLWRFDSRFSATQRMAAMRAAAVESLLIRQGPLRAVHVAGLMRDLTDTALHPITAKSPFFPMLHIARMAALREEPALLVRV